MSIFLVLGTLLIPRSVNNDRIVNLGFPIYFCKINFGVENSSMSGAPNKYLYGRTYNFTSAWEEHMILGLD